MRREEFRIRQRNAETERVYRRLIAEAILKETDGAGAKRIGEGRG